MAKLITVYTLDSNGATVYVDADATGESWTGFKDAQERSCCVCRKPVSSGMRTFGRVFRFAHRSCIRQRHLTRSGFQYTALDAPAPRD